MVRLLWMVLFVEEKIFFQTNMLKCFLTDRQENNLEKDYNMHIPNNVSFNTMNEV